MTLLTEQAVVVIFFNTFGLLGPVHKKVWLQLTGAAYVLVIFQLPDIRLKEEVICR